MKRRWLVAAFICSLVTAGCQSNVERYGEPLIFTTGTTTGVFYSLGAGMSTIWTNELEKRVASQASNGSRYQFNGYNLAHQCDFLICLGMCSSIPAADEGKSERA